MPTEKDAPSHAALLFVLDFRFAIREMQLLADSE